jgi:hypothetical protein
MNMLIQKYLLTHSLADLEKDHAVKARWSQDNKKFSLNYNMIESKENDKLACECRGLVLSPASTPKSDTDIVGLTKVLGRPMLRFFNQGQVEAAKINFEAKDTKFYEKLDGSFSMVYYDTNNCKWCVATRSVPDADQPIDGFEDYTFRTLFEKALTSMAWSPTFTFKKWTDKYLNKEMSYIFELCTPINRIVVDYKDYSVTLLAVIENATGQEFNIEPLDDFVVPRVCKTYNLGNLEDMIEFVSKRNPLEHEGIVACDRNFNRVKVKNPSYVALNRVRDSVAKSPRALMEICLQGKLDDVVPLLPEHLLDRAYKVRDGLRALIKNLDEQYLLCLAEAKKNSNGYDERKQLALAVNRKKDPKSKNSHKVWMGYTMKRYVGECKNFRNFVKKFSIDPETGRHKKVFLDNLLRAIESQ